MFDVYDFFQLVEVRLPAVIFLQIVVNDVGAQDLRERCIGGITRVRHQHRIAGIDKGEGDMQDALLRTDER